MEALESIENFEMITIQIARAIARVRQVDNDAKLVYAFDFARAS